MLQGPASSHASSENDLSNKDRLDLSLGNLELSISNLNTLGGQRMMQSQAQMSSYLPQRSRSQKPQCAKGQQWV